MDGDVVDVMLRFHLHFPETRMAIENKGKVNYRYFNTVIPPVGRTSYDVYIRVI